MKIKYPDITFQSWTRIPCKAVIYQIVPIEGDEWAADVAIFVEKPTGHPSTDKALQVPLNIVQKTPEMVFVYLQALGPLFCNTIDTVVVYNKKMEAEKVYRLSIGTKEQGIEVDINEFMQTLIKESKFMMMHEDISKVEEESENEFTVKPTNAGTKTRQ